MNRKQRTISATAEISGKGLHTGEDVTITLKPAAADAGVTFIRTDLPNRPRIEVKPENLTTKVRRSALTANGAEVQTIEHLMSAFAGVGVDNVEVEIDGVEVPGVDGSALPFVELIRQSGVEELDEELKPFRIAETITISMDNVTLVAMPAREGLTVSYVLDYDSPLLRSQYLELEVSEESYTREVAPARTFVLASEAQAMRDMGLGLGATFQNTLVIEGDSVVENELRFPDECVRHKLLDLIGDLAMLGRPLIGRVMATKSGHMANMRMVQQIAKQAVELGESQAPRADELLDISEIQRILPHRYPMLLVDRIVKIEGTERVVGLKNVTFNEPFFQGHWPEMPIMPGVLLIESMAQVAGVLVHQHLAGQARYAVLLSLDKVKLRKAVVPGDQVVLEARTIKVKLRTAQIHTEATVDGKLVAQAEIKVMLVAES